MRERSPDQPRIVAIVGNQLRHRWYLTTLAAAVNLDLVGAVIEEKRLLPSALDADAEEIIRRHFAARDAAELSFFGGTPEVEALGLDVLRVPFGGSNDNEVTDWVLARKPTVLCLFGCSIIKDQLLARLPSRVINLHLGLSPYYRGAATNFWPLVRGYPECVGATIHLATLDVDAGPVLLQARPRLQSTDDSHDAGCRAIAVGVKGLTGIIAPYLAGDVPAVTQSGVGQVFRNRDFGALAVRELWDRISAGMIPAYLADKPRRDANYPIVE